MYMVLEPYNLYSFKYQSFAFVIIIAHAIVRQDEETFGLFIIIQVIPVVVIG